MVIDLEERVSSLSKLLNKENNSDSKLRFNKVVMYYERKDDSCTARTGPISELVKGVYLTKDGIAAVLSINSSYITAFLSIYGSRLNKLNGRGNAVLYRLDDELIRLLPYAKETAKNFREMQKKRIESGEDWKKRARRGTRAAANAAKKRTQTSKKYCGKVPHKRIIRELRQNYPDIGSVLSGYPCTLLYHKAEAGCIFDKDDIWCRKEDVDKVKAVIVRVNYRRKKEQYEYPNRGGIRSGKEYRVSSEKRNWHG